MNERQRLLMQKIAEYGDHKWETGYQIGSNGMKMESIAYSIQAFTDITKMVTKWVADGTVDNGY